MLSRRETQLKNAISGVVLMAFLKDGLSMM
jgi:hypothetical protein